MRALRSPVLGAPIARIMLGVMRSGELVVVEGRRDIVPVPGGEWIDYAGGAGRERGGREGWSIRTCRSVQPRRYIDREDGGVKLVRPLDKLVRNDLVVRPQIVESSVHTQQRVYDELDRCVVERFQGTKELSGLDDTTAALLEDVELSTDALDELFVVLVADHADEDSDAVVAEMAAAGDSSGAALVVSG